MNTKCINVILCCFQGEAYIAEQLDSILAQDYPTVKIYVSDDYSSDNTCSIVEAYCEKFANITFHKNETNVGFLKNFEASMLRVDGNYIALSDQDDIWHVDKLTISMNELKLLEASNPNKPILVHSDLELIDATGKLIGSSFFDRKGLSLSSEKSLGQILGHCGIMGNTILMNRNLIDKALPFPPGLKYHDYWFAIVNEVFGARKTIHEPLVKYRIHGSNTSTNSEILKPVKKQNNKWYERKFLLPFMGNSRVETLDYLKDHYQLDDFSKTIVEMFCDYLLCKSGRFSSYMFLLRKGFLKKNITNRIIVFLKIMFVKRGINN